MFLSALWRDVVLNCEGDTCPIGRFEFLSALWRDVVLNSGEHAVTAERLVSKRPLA